MCQDIHQQKQYVIFVEKGRKDDLVIINYLQYTGNEIEISKLYKAISEAAEEGYELGGDLSSFEMNIDNPIPENAVDAHMNLEFVYYVRFRKYDGKFVCPFDPENDYDLSARGLDEIFYSEQIGCYFSSS